MNRLKSELHRLYACTPLSGAPDAAASPVLIDARETVRALVMELTRPAGWDILSKVWRGVQTELELPAPAIAVSGSDGLQLWFSLAEPITVPQARSFLESLRSRFVPDVEARRFHFFPETATPATRPARHARSVPALQDGTGNWSAFVAPDLAPVFEETPWLDIPPSEEGQAALLRGLGSILPAVLDAALHRLAPAVTESRSHTVDVEAPAVPMDTSSASGDPRRFLLRIMNDETVSMALRIEAAKALMPHSNDGPRRQNG